MRIISYILFLCLLHHSSQAQDRSPNPKSGTIKVEKKAESEQKLSVADTVAIESESLPPIVFTIVEQMPSFPGPENALLTYLSDNINYPVNSETSGIVYVTFIVRESGQVTNVKLLKGIGGGCDKEALRVVRAMPRWLPGKQRGNTVNVQYNLPVQFLLK